MIIVQTNEDVFMNTDSFIIQKLFLYYKLMNFNRIYNKFNITLIYVNGTPEDSTSNINKYRVIINVQNIYGRIHDTSKTNSLVLCRRELESLKTEGIEKYSAIMESYAQMESR